MNDLINEIDAARHLALAVIAQAQQDYARRGMYSKHRDDYISARRLLFKRGVLEGLVSAMGLPVRYADGARRLAADMRESYKNLNISNNADLISSGGLSVPDYDYAKLMQFLRKEKKSKSGLFRPYPSQSNR